MIVRTISYLDDNAPKKLTKSLVDTGFSVLRDHPIPLSLIEDVYKQWKKFFNSKKKNNYLFDPEKQDGFFPFETENAKGYTAKDLKEFYHVYPWGKYPSEINDSTHLLYKNIVELTSTILEWIQEETPINVKSSFSMPLPEMIKNSRNHLLRILHYPPLKGKEPIDAIRGAPHEDINLITLLVAGTEPGLQVKDTLGNWHDITCDVGSIAINTGDMLSEVSSGYFPSTTHQVINPNNKIKNQSRYSMPLFLHPRDDVQLSTRYTAREYLQNRIKEIGLKKI